ncbi:efflux RND transporter periplasmic adaptor subunit [Thioflexithrix psekupsensis]|nr:efflux RND transporter periplasmic adaptor subunit [Thioflexithrix psekupsensis]
MFKLFFYFLLGVISIIFLTACQRDSNAPDTSKRAASRTATVPVILQIPLWKNERIRVETIATAYAQKTATLYPKQNGEITAIYFRTGEWVKAGQILLQLDDKNEKIALELAHVQATDAERLFKRYQRAEGTQTFAPAVVDEARTAMQLRQIQLKAAQLAVEERQIIAPFSGYIGFSSLNIGDRVSPNTAIASLDDRKKLNIRFSLPESFAIHLQLGQNITLFSWRDNAPIQAEISEIDSQIDSRTRHLLIQAQFDNEPDHYRPGMSFRIQAEFYGKTYPAVPEMAVQWGGDGAYIWVVQEAQVQQLPISIVQRLEGELLIDAALTPEMPIIIEGVQRVRKGAQIESFDPILFVENAKNMPTIPLKLQ